MRLLRHILLFVCASFSFLSPAYAYADLILPPGSSNPDVRLVAVDTATAGYTNATTSYTTVTGISFSVPATRYNYTTEYLRVCYWADVTKATSTTGTIQVNANGAAITASRRTVNFGAGQTALSNCYTVARASAAAQTVTLEAVSGDTATFTIANLQAELYIVRVLPAS